MRATTTMPSHCTTCGVRVAPQSPAGVPMPAGVKRYSARGMCDGCYHRQRRTGTTCLTKFARDTPCERCGSMWSITGGTTTVLCTDCTEVAQELRELQVWEPAS